MTNFQNLVSKRRSIRKYTEDKLSPEQVELILKAGLKAPSSKNACSWTFIAVEDKEDLNKLALCKSTASKFIADCALAIVVLGDPLISDVWVEDTSIASIIMQLQAEDLDLGSCWVQIRKRETSTGVSSEEYIKDLFDAPMHMRVLSVLAIGNKEQERSPFDEEKMKWEKIHIDKYKS